jgi:hypothetical protein
MQEQWRGSYLRRVTPSITRGQGTCPHVEKGDAYKSHSQYLLAPKDQGNDTKIKIKSDRRGVDAQFNYCPTNPPTTSWYATCVYLPSCTGQN